jgi:hypothetical protein
MLLQAVCSSLGTRSLQIWSTNHRPHLHCNTLHSPAQQGLHSYMLLQAVCAASALQSLSFKIRGHTYTATRYSHPHNRPAGQRLTGTPQAKHIAAGQRLLRSFEASRLRIPSSTSHVVVVVAVVYSVDHPLSGLHCCPPFHDTHPSKASQQQAPLLVPVVSGCAKH